MIALLKKQHGYGLIEMIVSVAIAGILGTGVTVFAVQTMRETTNSSARMHAVQQLETAGYWVSRDVQTAQTVTVGQTGGFPLQLGWTDINNNTFAVTFSISNGTILRSLVENGGAAQQMTITRSVNSDPSLTYCTYAGSLLTFNVSATVNSLNVSRTYEILKRTW